MDFTLTYRNPATGQEVAFTPQNGYMISTFTDPNQQSINFSSSTAINLIGDKIENQVVQSKTIGISGYLLGEGNRHRKAELLKLCAPLTQGELVYNDELVIQAFPKVSPTIERRDILPKFAFTLYCPYPYWHSKERHIQNLMGRNAAFSFPWASGAAASLSDEDRQRAEAWEAVEDHLPVVYTDPHFSFTTQVVAYAIVENTGSVAAKWKIAFTALSRLKNPRVYNMKTMQYIQVNATIDSGSTIVVDTTGADTDLAVYIQGMDGTQQNAFSSLDIDSEVFELAVGENLLQVSAQEGGESMEANIYHYSYYAGVDT